MGLSEGRAVAYQPVQPELDRGRGRTTPSRLISPSACILSSQNTSHTGRPPPSPAALIADSALIDF